MARNYSFTFNSEGEAKVFVDRAAHYCVELAFYRDGTIVHIIDPSEESQREELLRLARSSGARQAAWRT